MPFSGVATSFTQARYSVRGTVSPFGFSNEGFFKCRVDLFFPSVICTGVPERVFSKISPSGLRLVKWSRSVLSAVTPIMITLYSGDGTLD